MGGRRNGGRRRGQRFFTHPPPPPMTPVIIACDEAGSPSSQTLCSIGGPTVQASGKPITAAAGRLTGLTHPVIPPPMAVLDACGCRLRTHEP